LTLSYIALGANLGEAEETLRIAARELAALPNARLLATSSLYRTAPVGLKNQPDFINAALALENDYSATEMLQILFDIEQRFGRQRSVPNAARTLDLDLLLHGNIVSKDTALTLPHPRMHERAFVLAPLHEIAPALVIPDRGAVSDLLAQCADQRIQKMD
jgi:2-amino-4-hydroxy-6-hydroxymethyldihydropteridine diphosphokinase